jgi:hypothetical protein
VLQAVEIFIVCLTGFFLGPFLILGYVQLCNFLVNKTTNERFGFNARRFSQTH